MPTESKILQAVGEQFLVEGLWQKAIPYGTGHINDTYRVRWQKADQPFHTILQRINHRIFKNPALLMDNIQRVSAHLHAQNNRPGNNRYGQHVLTIIPARNQKPFYEDAAGNFWRMYVYVRDALTLEVCTCPEQAYEAAKAFGEFQARLADLPNGRLHETIPDFHHTPRRLQALEQAVQDDPLRRREAVQPEIDFCRERQPLTSLITDLLASGQMPERVTHNDTKLNNVMIDARTGRGLCVIDLDTVMSGCALYDFGDMVRTMPRTAAEDEPDLDKVSLDLSFFEALTRGYLEATHAFLQPVEREHLVAAGRLITLTIGIRFLTDYLLGDVYFKTHRPHHNLDRARVQFKMVQSMEQQNTAMQAIVRRYAQPQ